MNYLIEAAEPQPRMGLKGGPALLPARSPLSRSQSSIRIIYGCLGPEAHPFDMACLHCRQRWVSWRHLRTETDVLPPENAAVTEPGQSAASVEGETSSVCMWTRSLLRGESGLPVEGAADLAVCL